jgi:hypothetical protein
MKYTLYFYGDHESRVSKNDDCITGDEFATEAEARQRFDEIKDRRWVGPWCHAVIRDPKGALVFEETRKREKSLDDDAEERSELFMAGMGGGVDAYNEAIGSPLDDEDSPARLRGR